ncbi:hypothetical protein GIB67_036069 [Kingdonia uniflora]|uniref:Uncharacterized protein n=1 Tax=Kingdonia uniflora TaxID=39325 RepID=A0A7J7N8P6_9MAGN|nr:hypothetical protein GIB67_036069 [Kingdonia uniflora]
MGQKKAPQVDGEDNENKAKVVFRGHPIIKMAFIEKCQNQGVVERMFEGTIATGDYAYATGSEYAPTTQPTSEFVHIVDGVIPMDTVDFGASGIDNPRDGINISIDDVPISPTTQPSPASTTPHTPASRNGSAKGKRVAANVEPSPFSLITELISAISSNGPGFSSSNNGNTMSEVMNILDKMLDTNERGIFLLLGGEGVGRSRPVQLHDCFFENRGKALSWVSENAYWIYFDLSTIAIQGVCVVIFDVIQGVCVVIFDVIQRQVEVMAVGMRMG